MYQGVRIGDFQHKPREPVVFEFDHEHLPGLAHQPKRRFPALDECSGLDYTGKMCSWKAQPKHHTRRLVRLRGGRSNGCKRKLEPSLERPHLVQPLRLHNQLLIYDRYTSHGG